MLNWERTGAALVDKLEQEVSSSPSLTRFYPTPSHNTAKPHNPLTLNAV